jgi:hypothetical protein
MFFVSNNHEDNDVHNIDQQTKINSWVQNFD